MELGLSQYVVMWVDDHIFDAEWENKKHMEKATTFGTDSNVHFVPKSSTESAVAFLKSEFGQRLIDSKNFRIVTDMNRHNEQPSHNAGARLIKRVRNLGFKQPCLVFTGDQAASEALIKEEFGSFKNQGITVTTRTRDLEEFVQFS